MDTQEQDRAEAANQPPKPQQNDIPMLNSRNRDGREGRNNVAVQAEEV